VLESTVSGHEHGPPGEAHPPNTLLLAWAGEIVRLALKAISAEYREGYNRRLLARMALIGSPGSAHATATESTRTTTCAKRASTHG
jgi:hypothetical protein